MTILFNVLLVIIGILLFGFVIFFHEFGHFFTAKLFKIRVNEFAIGMGPKLLSRQKGDTTYSLRLLPIGGFCDMNEDEIEGNGNFNEKPVWQRMIVILAGAFMNIVLGFLFMLIVVCTQDKYLSTQIAGFAENSSTQAAGFEIGDEIKRIDGYAIYTDRDLSFALSIADLNSVDFEIERNGARLVFNDIHFDQQMLQHGDFYVDTIPKTIGSTLRKAFFDTYAMSRMVIESLKGIVTGRFGLNDMAGPVGTAQVIAQAASAGLKENFGVAVLNILMMIILVTVNLGIVNLLPIPALDGGRFLFLLVELILRRPVPQKYEAWIHTVGFVLVIGLMLFVTFNDIVRIVTG